MYAAVIGNGVKQTFTAIPFVFAGVERFRSLTDEQRAEVGFLPVINITPDYDSTYEKGTGRPTYTIFPDRVELLYEVTDITLQDAKRIKLEQIENRVERVLEAGVVAGGRTWSANAEQRNALTSIAVVANAAGGSLPPAFVWRDASNVSASLTLAQLMALLQAITLKLFNTFEAAAQKREQVADATTVAQVKAITLSN